MLCLINLFSQELYYSFKNGEGLKVVVTSKILVIRNTVLTKTCKVT